MVIVLNGMAFGVLLLVLSTGLALIFGLRGVINFAHGAIYMVAAYIGLTISTEANYWVALVGVPVIFGLIGLVADRWGLRYLTEREPMEIMLLTFGLTFVLSNVVTKFWGTQPRTLEPPSVLDGTIEIFGVAYPTYRYFLIAVGLLIAAGLIVWLRRSKTGLQVRAVSIDRSAAGVVGVNVDRVSATVVAMGLAMAGLAGVLAGPYLSLSPNMGVEILVLTFIVVVVGGLGSISGPMAAALILGMLNAVTAVHLPDISAYVPYALMLGILLFRPKGIAGTRSL